MIRRRLAERRTTRGRQRHSSNPTETGGVQEEPVEPLMAGGTDPEESGEEEEPRKKPMPWREQTSCEVYEEQLEKLQDQLIATMIEKQSLEAELEERTSEAKVELKRLRKENQELLQRVEVTGFQEPRNAMDRLSEASSLSSSNRGSYGGSTFTVATSEDGFESVSVQPDTVLERKKQKRRRGRRPVDIVKDWVYDFLSDFTEDAASLSEESSDETTPLTVKRLKENLGRVAKSSKPLREFVSWIIGVLQWKNPAESLVAFLIYMYCVWHGWLIQLLLFIALIKLTLNYLHTSGLAEQFGIARQRGVLDETDGEQMGLTDKLHLVKQVGQTVQNASGSVSNVLEKARNLVLWHYPEATGKLYQTLWVFFLVSLILPNSYVVTAVGLGMGMKLFIVDNIYRKYPKVKDKYDSVAKLWASLPTDTELLENQSLTVEDAHQLPRQPSGDSLESSIARLSEEDVAFCQRFQLSPDELPLTSWQGGKRCTMLDKDKPLVGSKAGRLFLTHSFLCFERPSRTDKQVIALADIKSLSQAKPFAMLPGSGMSIELQLKSVEKPLIFGAILHRDQVYQSILDQGMILGLPWGTDPDHVEHTPTSGGAKGEGQNEPSNSKDS